MRKIEIYRQFNEGGTWLGGKRRTEGYERETDERKQGRAAVINY